MCVTCVSNAITLMKKVFDSHLLLRYELANFLWCRRLCFSPLNELLLEQDRLVVLCQPAEYRPIRTALALPVK